MEDVIANMKHCCVCGKAHRVDENCKVADDFFKRNKKAIKGAFKLLQDKKYVKENLEY